MPKTKINSDEYYVQGIKPVINPFGAFILYLIAVHYFCFSLWPLAWWKICVTFDLLNKLTGNEFLDIASGISFSTGLMLLFFFFSAGYNTTDEGATHQRDEPYLIYQRIVKILNNSACLTTLAWLIPYVSLCILVRNTAFEHFDGTPLPNLHAVVSEVFLDFSSYYRFASRGTYSIYFPFHFGSLLAFSCCYFLILILMVNNRFPFFILLEPLSRHFWQRAKHCLEFLKRR